MGMKIGIIGNGYVGQATCFLGASDGVETKVYDKIEDECIPKGIRLNDLRHSDLVFICVPTPSEKNGKCHTEIVRKLITQLLIGPDPILHYPQQIVVRSTVPVGFCEKHNVNFMPEFLTEANAGRDVLATTEWIFGLSTAGEMPSPRVQTKVGIQYLIDKAFPMSRPEIIWTDPTSAELCKLIRNTYLASKVSFFNEMQSFCKARKIDYGHVQNLVCLDHRITKSHTNVPGPDGKKGFGGTCFPKDIASLIYQFGQLGVDAPILRAVMRRNLSVDRPEMDWLEDKGRTVVEDSK